MNPPPSGSRRPYFLFAAYCVVCLLASIWPGFAYLGARIEPRVLGLPFSFAWVIGWVLLTFVVLIFFYRAVSKRS